ncbi:MAG: tRNA (adenosine(37)-N6)-threonylcarbamoyltransferase complex dimerization subunit type 1 TsaB [Verrucomicrobia bacterium Tous-C9LFEB]|nr:MAG: tRNA (adenosine(37)-N6)-threonylcarbamoyltransferase complex dimerization subunit type 1 TsaB [Verrucomicrobia bacterium Tous-C9LFEB]
MLELAIETSTTRGSLALGNRSVVVREIIFEGKQQHSSQIFNALMQLGLPRLALARIIIGIGPGSFSGIRVALAAAQAIALVQRVPVHGICSAFSIAAQHSEVTRLGVFADARRGEFYGTIFNQGKMEKESFILTRDELETELGKVTLAVSAEAIPGVSQRTYPRARDLLLLPPDLQQWVRHRELEPIYLREPMVAA